MRIKPRHIRKFEAFIQNSKDPNEKEESQPKNNKKPAPGEDDTEKQDDSEEENDPVDEMKKYFAQQQKNHPHLWKSAI
jgi:hypothetical protein